MRSRKCGQALHCLPQRACRARLSSKGGAKIVFEIRTVILIQTIRQHDELQHPTQATAGNVLAH